MSAVYPARRLRLAWLFTLLAALPIVLWMPAFFQFIAAKPGISLPDPLLDVLPSRDLSTPLFVLLYGAIAMFVIGLVRHRVLFLRTAQAYVFLLLLRMISMAVFTLEPPQGMVELHDPVSALVYPNKMPFSKDLFFSGHTATLFLFYLAAPWRIGKPLLLLATVIVGCAVLVQHVHWTIDVLAAPFGAYAAWWLSGHATRWGVGAATSGNGAA
ncbi:MAG TPA: phosphatase PAP2-related protein [Flavobacteriales bacterium]|nr:phosphatase PAP2-related protein [Flavobacteriales bacterium]